MLITIDNHLPILMQLMDSSCPIGSFVYSFGLEAHVVQNYISSITDLKRFCLHVLKYQLINFEYFFARKSYEYALKEDIVSLIKLERKKRQHLYYSVNEAQRTLGRNILKIIPVHYDSFLKNYKDDIFRDESLGDEMSVLAVLSGRLSISLENLILLHYKRSMISFGNAVLKCSKLKVSEVQEALFSIDYEADKLLKDIPNSFMVFNPVFDFVQAHHKAMVPKMFKI